MMEGKEIRKLLIQIASQLSDDEVVNGIESSEEILLTVSNIAIIIGRE